MWQIRWVCFLRRVLATSCGILVLGVPGTRSLAAPVRSPAGGSQPAGSRPQPGTVLVLDSYHAGYSWSDAEVQGIVGVLRRVDPFWQPFVEYLDAKNFPDKRQFPWLKKLLEKKYGGRAMSVVVACDDPAIDFALDCRDELWPGVPIVFCGANGFTPGRLRGEKNVTGVAESLNIEGTLDAALRLLPATRVVVVAHDYTQTGLGSRQALDSAALRFSGQVEFRVLPEVSVDELLRLVASLPPDHVVLALSYSRDRDGRVFDHAEIADLLARSSSVPVFVCHEERLGSGVVGGWLLGGREHGRQAGDLVLRVLRGEKPDDIPVALSLTRPMFDWDALRRWHIPPSALPPEASVINHPEDFYRDHRAEIWTGAGIFLGLVAAVLVLSLNVRRRQRAERRADAERSFLQGVVDGLPDPVFVLAPDHAVRLMNRAAHALVDPSGSGGAAVGEPVLHASEEACGVQAPCPVRDVVLSGIPSSYERRHVDPRGEVRTLTLAAAPMRDDGGGVSGVIVSSHDITDLCRTHEELVDKERRLDHLAHHDILTGLPNRLLFQDRLQLAITRARRNQNCTALLFLDLDRFKNVNDTLGHEAGDAMLRTVAERLTACMRAEDTVSRVGGDEFTLLLEGPVDGRGASQVARKILETLAAPFVVGRQEFHVGASIGIALYPVDGESAESLVRNADAAMYVAKERGRGNWQFFTETLNRRARRAAEVERALRRAISAGGLAVHFQPMVSLSSGKIVGAEALLRWEDPDLGAVRPSEFVPVAEESGLIGALGDLVLRLACRAARSWDEAGRPGISISVNISARQFWNGEILGAVERALAESGLAAGRLVLELTEGILLPGTPEVMRLLSELRALGVRLSVDDFGTGYSSLSYLKRLPLNDLKVAQEFVRGITVDPNDAAIVRAILSLAASLGFHVVAEGVETAEHVEFFRAHGCNVVQGHYFSPALPAAEFAALLETGVPEHPGAPA